MHILPLAGPRLSFVDGGGLPWRIARFLEQRPPGLIRTGAAVGALLVGLLDYLTGPELASLLFYLVPVAVAGATGRRRDGIAIGVLAGACWFAAEALRGREYEVEWILFWNGLSRMVAFSLVGVLVAMSRPLEAQARPGRQCAHCGSTNTVELQHNLVCLSCRRVFTEDSADAPT